MNTFIVNFGYINRKNIPNSGLFATENIYSFFIAKTSFLGCLVRKSSSFSTDYIYAHVYIYSTMHLLGVLINTRGRLMIHKMLIGFIGIGIMVSSCNSKHVKKSAMMQSDSTNVQGSNSNSSKADNSENLDDLFGKEHVKTKADPLRAKADLYESEIMARIHEYWRPSVQSEQPVILEYTVNPNGTLSKVIIVNSSGNRSLDLQAKRAIEMAFLVNPIPTDISESPFKRTCRIFSTNRF